MSPGLSPGVGMPAQPQGSRGPMGSSSPTTASHCCDTGGEGKREPTANKGPKPPTPTSCCSPPGCCLLNPPHPAPLGDISHICVPDSGQELLRATSPTVGQARTKPLSWKANIIPCSCESPAALPSSACSVLEHRRELVFLSQLRLPSSLVLPAPLCFPGLSFVGFWHS